ncbi:MAG: fumarylacetoacetate hydrolase family protein [Pseudomonadales bacterium]
MGWYGLATYAVDGNMRPALVLEDLLFDLEAVFRAQNSNAELPAWLASLNSIISGWDSTEKEVETLALVARSLVQDNKITPVENGVARLEAPYMPGRIFCTASNYIEHAKEMETVLAAKAESSPYVFMKANTAVIGPKQTIRIPPETEKPDWEVELGVVIGRGGRRITVDQAIDHIAGYTVINDISARDMNRRTDYPFKHDWFRGKSWDTFCPLGPWFVPKGCIDDPHNLKLQQTLNGELMQDGNTSELIFNAFEQIEYLASILTLQPGDVIATGTPAGVGMGQDLYLKPGDVLVASVEGVGAMENPVAAEEL